MMKRRKSGRSTKKMRRHNKRQIHPIPVRVGGFSITRTRKGLRISLSLTREIIQSTSKKRKGGYSGKVLITA